VGKRTDDENERVPAISRRLIGWQLTAGRLRAGDALVEFLQRRVDLRPSHGVRRRVELSLQFGTRQPQRLHRAVLLGVGDGTHATAPPFVLSRIHLLFEA
jgi:hypothetical protein